MTSTPRSPGPRRPAVRALPGAALDGFPDPVLAGAIAASRVGRDDDDDLAAVYAALLGATVYSPAVLVPESGRLALVAVRRSDGATAVVAFTGIEALLAWRPDARPLPRRGRELAHIAVTEGYAALVIDPGSDASLVIPAGPLATLAAGRIPESRLHLRPLDPADPVFTPALRAALTVTLHDSPAVAAYAAEMGGGHTPFAAAVAVVGADGSIGDRLAVVLGRSPGSDPLPAGFALIAVDDDQAAALAAVHAPLWRR